MPRRRRNKVQRLVIVVKKFVAFLISHVGLCALVIAYTLLGAFIFQAVEGPQGEETQISQINTRLKAVELMWDATYKHNMLELTKWEDKTWAAVLEYKDILLKTIKKGYDAKENQWTFFGAFLYSLSVITTIGYGNITCRTMFGKALTIAYAILGIPLMLLFLTNIGDVLAKISKILYRRSVKWKLLMVLWHRRRRQRQAAAASAAAASRTNAKRAGKSKGGGNAVKHKKSTVTTTAKQSTVVAPKISLSSGTNRKGAKKSTIVNPFFEQPPPVQGQHLQGHQLQGQQLQGQHIQGQQLQSQQVQGQQLQLQLSSTGGKSALKYRTSNCSQDSFLLTPSGSAGQQAGGQRLVAITPVEPLTIFEEMNIDVLSHQFELEELSIRESFEEKLGKMNVPLWLVTLTMMLYLIGGAMLFSLWENWEFLDGFYFCYVSLATIGFGDLFPGRSLADENSAQEKLIITSMYLLFGMALIAMCFNLAQEEVVNKVVRLATKLGIVKSDSYDNA